MTVQRHMAAKLIAPLLVAAFAVASEYSGLDVWWTSHFYDAETQSWPLKSNFITAGVLHSFGRDLVSYAMVAFLLCFVASFFVSRLRPYRKGFGYMVIGGLLGVAIVAVLKATTHIYTPWDLAMFGGDKPHIRLFDSVPPGLPVGEAFPGGHSSGGFAFLALYFALGYYKPAYRFLGLAVGLILGGLFGLTQELRGAHFLSHDLFSLVICWYSALAVFQLMFRRELREAAQAQS